MVYLYIIGNALIHSCWSSGVPVQIRIEDDAMYISNDCVFPSGWTTETLMQRHRSRPYNPSLANAFFRAGYVESWGRGIQKICESCEAHGTAQPEYIVHAEDIMLKLTALPIAHSLDSKVPKYQDDTLEDTLESKILERLKQEPATNQTALANLCGVSVPTIKRITKKMSDKGSIVRKGGKRLGYWEIHD